MANILTLPTKPMLTCDECGCPSHHVLYRRDGDVLLVVAIECANCGKTIRLEAPDGDAA